MERIVSKNADTSVCSSRKKELYEEPKFVQEGEEFASSTNLFSLRITSPLEINVPAVKKKVGTDVAGLTHKVTRSAGLCKISDMSEFQRPACRRRASVRIHFKEGSLSPSSFFPACALNRKD